MKMSKIIVYFAIDNCNFNNDSPEGKGEFHGTTQIDYQQLNIQNEIQIHNNLEMKSESSRPFKGHPFPEAFTSMKRVPQTKQFDYNIKRSDKRFYKQWDIPWFLTKSQNKNFDYDTPNHNLLPSSSVSRTNKRLPHREFY